MTKHYCDCCTKEITGEVNPKLLTFRLRFGGTAGNETIQLHGSLKLEYCGPINKDPDWCLFCLVACMARALKVEKELPSSADGGK